ncbi:tRNA pseudouridine(55) synthase TruB [Alicyclobacillus herbarius]|uniref:tRNA pseudouridine(55) synthase TruB n=1 Tax=Alicyclobacillus herbarius TaxID=122960 RepID=UPI000428B7FD|nr:tRNA pseudouridine(55) synthase TruB [Alicyclobacillus herbarius]
MIDGVLVIDKPAGMTSHDVVSRVRRRLHTRKVGHAGTLDPDATGVLVLCVGDATRLIEYAVAAEKEYVGEVVFGQATDTDDASGSVTDVMDATRLEQPAVEAAAAEFVGGYDQRVPAYSAVHIEGQRAYQLARRGEVPDLPVRHVDILEFQVLAFFPGPVGRAVFRVVCSKGTYIRALCRDWGERLGFPAHMGSLRRTRSGSFSLQDAVSLAAWEELDQPADALQPMASAVSMLPQVCLAPSLCTRLAHGQAIAVADTVAVDALAENRGLNLRQDDEVAVFAACGDLAAVARLTEREGRPWLQPRKVFWKKGHACK